MEESGFGVAVERPGRPIRTLHVPSPEIEVICTMKHLRNILLFAPMLMLSPVVEGAVFTATGGLVQQAQSITTTVAVTGDGTTQLVSASLVFDESRLKLSTVSGVIAGAGQNGASCTRTASNRIEIIRLGTSALPPSPTLLCNLSFQAWPHANPGSAALTLINPSCSSDTSAVTPCTAVSGSVTVTGTAPIGPGAQPLPNRFLLVLLKNSPGAPTVEQVTGFDFSSGQTPPLIGLTVGAPISVFPYLVFRAQGDFAQYLRAYPETARARLERYLMVEYSPGTNLDTPLQALRNDQYVEYANAPLPMEFSVTDGGAVPNAQSIHPNSAFQQYHLEAVRAPQAWARAGGWALVGIADSGIATEHPDLRSQSGGGSATGNLVSGGNYLPYYSYNLGDLPSAAGSNPDERVPLPTANQTCDLLDGVDDDLMFATSAGHGTHVSGLIGANQDNPSQTSIEGICRKCGLGMWKVATAFCEVDDIGARVTPTINITQMSQAVTIMSQIGMQVINQSFGSQSAQPINNFCASNPMDAYCQALKFANETDVLVSSASGNARTRIQFPAREYRVSAIGGTDETGAIWDESPGSFGGCPVSASGVLTGECGSNYTAFAGERRQEIVTPARQVRSTFYPGFSWNPVIGCGDAFGDSAPSDGVGLCTGTSMSTPIASGIYGLLRSINPLLPIGNPETPVVPGIRSVVASTTNRAQSGFAWENHLGYGIPDTERAAARILGTVGGRIALNRASPLFGLYSSGAQDYAAVATPQSAMALARYQVAAYATTSGSGGFIAGSAIPGYESFPHEVATPSPSPRARAYILTTEYSPAAGHQLTPLYFIDRTRPFPLGCTNPMPGCNTLHRDFALITGETQLNAAFTAGYRYAGIQGYVYTSQAPGTEALWAQCNAGIDDCAVFLSNQRNNFETAGYTLPMPGMTSGLIGYAYPTTDTDGDALPDAMERVIGTNLSNADSDGDLLTDGIEYPLAGLPVGDPCSGPAISCLTDSIFGSSFE